MGNNLANSISQRKAVKSALDRISDMEGQLPRLFAQVNGGFNSFGQRMNETTEILNAVSQLLGQELVSAKIQENRLARAEEAAQAQREGITKALAEGRIVPATVIGEKSVFVTKETDKDKAIIPPGRLQLEFANVVPDFKPKFLGLGVGGVVETPSGGALEVTEVYDFVDPPPQTAAAANTDTAAATEPTPSAGAGDAPVADAPASAGGADTSAPAQA